MLLSLMLSLASVTDPSATEVLRRTQQAVTQVGGFHCVMEIAQVPEGGEERRFFLEARIDNRRSLVRTEFRRVDRPFPHLVVVAGATGFTMVHRDAGEKVHRDQPLSLTSALEATMIGELWRTAYRGDLAGMKLESFRPPRLTPSLEPGASRTSFEIEFGGNRIAQLEISAPEFFPRRIHGALPQMIRDERVISLQVLDQVPEDWFRIAGAEKLPTVSRSEATGRWRKIPRGPDRWIPSGKPAPAVTGQSLDEAPRHLDFGRAESTVLAFWFDGYPPAAEGVAEVEKALAQSSAEATLRSVFPGNDADAAKAAIRRYHFRHEVILGTTAFESYGVTTCPAFFVIDTHGNLVGATSEPQEVLPYLEGL